MDVILGVCKQSVVDLLIIGARAVSASSHILDKLCTTCFVAPRECASIGSWAELSYADWSPAKSPGRFSAVARSLKNRESKRSCGAQVERGGSAQVQAGKWFGATEAQEVAKLERGREEHSYRGLQQCGGEKCDDSSGLTGRQIAADCTLQPKPRHTVFGTYFPAPTIP